MSTMSKPKHLAVALVCALAFTGCDKKGDVISNAAQADPKVGIAAPGIEEVKAIAEEGFNYGYVGSRATGNEAGDYLVAGPDWKGRTPAGIKGVLRPTTQFTLAIFLFPKS
jgi:outer membrane lipoprotein SlyB